MLRSKIVVVILGALLVGVVGAALGVLSAQQPRSAAGSIASSTATGTSASATATPVGTPTATDTPTLAPSPSPTPTRVPPTATPVPAIGQTLDLHGSVGSINQSQSTFVLRVSGGSYTVKVDSGTQWPGYAKSISGTSPLLASGMQAEVVGVYQGGGTILADPGKVDTQQPDN